MPIKKVTYREGQVLAVAHEQLNPRHVVELERAPKKGTAEDRWVLACHPRGDCEWAVEIKGEIEP